MLFFSSDAKLISGFIFLDKSEAILLVHIASDKIFFVRCEINQSKLYLSRSFALSLDKICGTRCEINQSKLYLSRSFALSL